MRLSAGGTRLRIEALTNGKVELQNVQTNELRSCSQSKLIADIQGGIVLRDAAAADGTADISAMNGTKEASQLLARQESAAAIQDLLNKKQWLDTLAREGVDVIRDVPWVRTTIERIAATELKGIKRYEVSTLARIQRALRVSGNDWTAVVPRYSSRGGAGKTRLAVATEDLISEVINRVKEGRGPIVKQKIYDEIRDRIQSENLARPGEEIPIPGHSTVYRLLTITQY